MTPRKRQSAFSPQPLPSAVLIAAGIGLIVAGVVQDDARVAEAIVFVAFGSGLLALGATFPRLTRAKVGKEGFELDLSAREATSLLVSEPPVGVAAEVDDLDDDDIIAATRSLLAQNTLLPLLRADEGPLQSAQLELYLYDADAGLLRPMEMPDRPTPPDAWPAGRGAVGTAWERGEFVVVEGRATSDETYGLSPEQQEHHQELTAVAAMPVVNAQSQVLAVLGASTIDAAHGLASQEAFDDLVVRGQLIARILVDVLKWFDDDYPAD